MVMVIIVRVMVGPGAREGAGVVVAMLCNNQLRIGSFGSSRPGGSGQWSVVCQ